MTANELADDLDNANGFQYVAQLGLASQAATMLRQQQAEIEALKQIIDANNLNQNIKQFVKPTNEPVAWMDDLSFFTEQPDDMDGVTPLYTHPIKNLEDIDINITWNETSMRDFGKDELNFARAILRKAQER